MHGEEKGLSHARHNANVASMAKDAAKADERRGSRSNQPVLRVFHSLLSVMQHTRRLHTIHKGKNGEQSMVRAAARAPRASATAGYAGHVCHSVQPTCVRWVALYAHAQAWRGWLMSNRITRQWPPALAVLGQPTTDNRHTCPPWGHHVGSTGVRQREAETACSQQQRRNMQPKLPGFTPSRTAVRYALRHAALAAQPH